MEYKLKADKLTIKNQKASGQSHVYIASNELAVTSGLGTLIIIAEIKSKEKKIPAILSQIVQELSEYYYHSPTKNAEAALETACQYFNENIIEISQKNWQWLKERIGIMIATVQDNRLSLSNYNNMRSWLAREGKIHDISGSDSESKKNVTPKKIMSQIITGQLEDNDVVLLSNATIFDYFSEEKIRKTITTLAPTQACAFLKNTLVDYKVAADFSTVIVKLISCQKNERESSESAPVNLLQRSEMDVSLQQGKTNQLALQWKKIREQSTIIVDGLKQKTDQAIKKITNKKSEAPSPAVGLPSEDTAVPGKTDLRLKLGFGQGVTGQGNNWLAKLKFKEYRLIIFIVVIALLFGGSLKVISDRKKTSEETKKAEAAITAIKDKISSIEAALIYKDDTKAQELLKETEALLASFNYQTETAKSEWAQLSKQAEDMKNKVYKLESINTDGYFASWGEEIKPKSSLAFLDSTLYFAGEGKFYKVSAKDGVVSQVTELAGAVSKVIDLDGKQMVLYGNGVEISFITKGQTAVQKKSFALPDGDRAIDIAIYNKKIYLLGDKSIYSYNYNNSGYDRPTAWLKQENGIANNKSIAVDGNVWLSAAEGTVSRFFKGKKETFALTGLYEPISTETSVYTKDGLNNLYLVDQEKNRITVANKQGKVLRQILGDNLDKIISVLPAAGEKELYIMTEKGIYKLGL